MKSLLLAKIAGPMFGTIFRHTITALGAGLAVSGGIDPDAINAALSPDAEITRAELFGAFAVILGYYLSGKEKVQRQAA